MKKIISMFLFAALLCSQTIFASNTLFFGKSQITISEELGQKNVLLTISKIGKEKITLQVQGENQEILATQFIENEGNYTQRLVLRDLPQGRIIVFLENIVSRYAQPILLSNISITVLENELKMVYKPTLRVKENSLRINWQMLKAQTVYVEILDATSRQVVFQKNVTSENNIFMCNFNIAQLADKQYVITMKTKDAIHELPFNKQSINLETLVALVP